MQMGDCNVLIWRKADIGNVYALNAALAAWGDQMKQSILIMLNGDERPAQPIKGSKVLPSHFLS